MTTNKNIEKYLWITTVVFVTYLFLGSFVVSRNFYELVYLMILYSFIGVVKIVNRKK